MRATEKQIIKLLNVRKAELRSGKFGMSKENADIQCEALTYILSRITAHNMDIRDIADTNS